jgi:hypothetical protein
MARVNRCRHFAYPRQSLVEGLQCDRLGVCRFRIGFGPRVGGHQGVDFDEERDLEGAVVSPEPDAPSRRIVAA